MRPRVQTGIVFGKTVLVSTVYCGGTWSTQNPFWRRKKGSFHLSRQIRGCWMGHQTIVTVDERARELGSAQGSYNSCDTHMGPRRIVAWWGCHITHSPQRWWWKYTSHPGPSCRQDSPWAVISDGWQPSASRKMKYKPFPSATLLCSFPRGT